MYKTGHHRMSIATHTDNGYSSNGCIEMWRESEGTVKHISTLHVHHNETISREQLVASCSLECLMNRGYTLSGSFLYNYRL
jgi:hypothetical protein